MVRDMNIIDEKILQKVGTLDWEGVDNFARNQEKHVHSKPMIKQKKKSTNKQKFVTTMGHERHYEREIMMVKNG